VIEKPEEIFGELENIFQGRAVMPDKIFADEDSQRHSYIIAEQV